jgi:tetratricopeptide (TPR) repeat protein
MATGDAPGARLGNPPTYPAGGTFRELLDWHLQVWGTRARSDCSIVSPNRPWVLSEFAQLVHEGSATLATAKKNLRNWRLKEIVPGPHEKDRIDRIFAELFGDNPNLAEWKQDLQRALREGQILARERQGLKPRSYATSKPPLAEAPIVPTRIPRPTSHFVGRTDEVDRLAAVLAAEGSSAALLLQGGPGIGKTELTKAIANDSRVFKRFGERRWFVSLETATTAGAMRDALVRATGNDPAAGFSAALRLLAEKPSLIVLDNLETPWERAEERSATEATLAEMAATPGLSLLASFRGRDWVKEPAWTSHFVEPLVPEVARALFSEMAGQWTLSDEYLDEFLDTLGGVPLAINLVARRAHGRRSLQPLWREWSRIGTAFAANPDYAPGPQTSLERSILLSLQSSRITRPSLRLFGFLGCLPAGLSKTDLEAILGDPAFAAEECLLNIGLAIERDNRLDLLPPIRDYAFRHHKPVPDDASALSQNYIDLVRKLAPQIGKDVDAGPRLEREFRNIESMLRIASQENRQIGLLDAVAKLQLITVARGIYTDIFKVLADSVTQESNENKKFRAYCLYLIGEAAVYRDEIPEARAKFEEALTLFDQIGDVRGQAACIYEFGNIALKRSEYGAARQAYSDALDLYLKIDLAVGIANCTGRLGEVDFGLSKYEEATVAFKEALKLAQQSGQLQIEANYVRYLGEISYVRGDLEAALKGYQEALQVYQRVGSVIGEAGCIKGFGDIALARFDAITAQAAYEEARARFASVGALAYQAECTEGLGDVALIVSGECSAKELYAEALPIYRCAGDVKGERRCAEKLANLGSTAE